MNSGVRLTSNLEALGVSLEHPLGLGIEAGKQVLQNDLGYAVTHNAFLHFAVLYGPLLAAPLALLMFVLALQVLAGIQNVWFLEALLSLHLCGLFLFEELFSVPTLMIITGWLVAVGGVWFVRHLQVTKAQTPKFS
jgi:hypothetical protein